MKRAIYINANQGYDRFQSELTWARDAGFLAVGISVEGLGYKANAEETVKRCRALLDEYGMICTQTHLQVYGLECSSVNIPELDACINREIALSAMLGAPACVYHPRTAMSYNYDRELSYKHNCEAFKPFLATAEKSDILFAVEYCPIHPDCPHYRFYASDPDDLCELVDTFQGAPIGVCWDTGHANLMSFDQARAIKKLGARIVCTHVSNNFRERDWHLLPFYGWLDWKSVMAAFREIGYDRDLTLEVRMPDDDRLYPSFFRLAFDSVTILADMLSDNATK